MATQVLHYGQVLEEQGNAKKQSPETKGWNYMASGDEAALAQSSQSSGANDAGMDRGQQVGGEVLKLCNQPAKAAASKKRKVTSSTLMEMLHSQGFKCNLTGQPLSPANMTLDHIVPLSRGGVHDISNAQIILDVVNKAKGTMTNEEFIALCHQVAKANPTNTTH